MLKTTVPKAADLYIDNMEIAHYSSTKPPLKPSKKRLIQPNQLSSEMKKSLPYSIPNEYLDELNSLFTANKQYIWPDMTTYMVVPSYSEKEVQKACFATLFSEARTNSGVQKIIWRIPLTFWNKSPKLMEILKEYLDWVYSHPVWIEGMTFKQTEDDLFVEFETSIKRVVFMFTMGLLRRIDWVPHSVMRWHLLGKGKPLPELSRFFVSNFVKISGFPIQHGLKEIEASHFVWSVQDSIVMYKKSFVEFDKLLVKHTVPLTVAGSGYTDTRKFLGGPTSKEIDEIMRSLVIYEKEKEYETVISHW